MTLLKTFFDELQYKGCRWDGVSHSLLITHVLQTAVEYICYLNEIWPVKRVIAIPYSADSQAVAALRRRGIRVDRPASIKDVAPAALQAITEACVRYPLVVQEVGGYLAPYVSALQSLHKLLGIVEDTAQGHWRYSQSNNSHVPILSIAFSPLKSNEDRIIGDAVIFSLERVLREELRDVLCGKGSLVVGYGRIGHSCASALRGRRSEVAVYDLDPIATLMARLEGYRTGALDQLLADADIVVGATGRMALRAEIYSHIKNGAVLVSASSRDTEFDLRAIADFRVTHGNGIISTYRTHTGRIFHMLYEGQPLNFRDHSILGTYVRLVYGALYYSMQKVVAGDVEPGLSELSLDENRHIAEHFYVATYGDSARVTAQEAFGPPRPIAGGTELCD